jgi:hypothetical protein
MELVLINFLKLNAIIYEFCQVSTKVNSYEE